MALESEPRPERPPAPLRPVPDLGGTPVDDVDGRPAGTVVGALVEAANGMVRYLDVELDRAPRHVLVPIGHARLEEHVGGRRFRLRAAFRDELEAIPAYEPATPVDSDQERRVLEAHARSFYGERYYAHPAFDHSGLYAGEHPIVRGGLPPAEPLPLAPLSALPDYRIAPGNPDIRGRDVVAGDGERAGRVADLIVDPGAGAVRYAVVEREGGSRALLPVGYLEVDADDARLRAPALRRADVDALPDFREPVTRLDEECVRAVLEGRLDGDRRFDRPDFRFGPWPSP